MSNISLQLFFNVHFSLVVLCSTAIIEQEVTSQGLIGINHWTALKTSSHLTSKCKIYNQCDELPATPFLLFLLLFCKYKLHESILPRNLQTLTECQPSTLLDV